MKRELKQLSAASVAQEYPITDLVQDWYFNEANVIQVRLAQANYFLLKLRLTLGIVGEGKPTCSAPPLSVGSVQFEFSEHCRPVLVVNHSSDLSDTIHLAR